MTATAMTIKERPILFSGSMVKAILESRKTQTRRVIRPQPIRGQVIRDIDANGMHFVQGWYWDPTPRNHHIWHDDEDQNQGDWAPWFLAMCPYGGPGDRLWLRESFYAYGAYRYTGKFTGTGKPEVEFVDSTLESGFRYQYALEASLPKPASRYEIGWHKRPSIFMPRGASRITIEIKGVRVEQLQEIGVEDCAAEGIDAYNGHKPPARILFTEGWNSLNAKRGYSWEANPWVWAITFKRI